MNREIGPVEQERIKQSIEIHERLGLPVPKGYTCSKCQRFMPKQTPKVDNIKPGFGVCHDCYEERE